MLGRSPKQALIGMRGIVGPMRTGGHSRLAAFLGCRRGASAVEFALVLPVLLLFVIGMIEVAWIMYVQSAMEGALRQAARYGITGQGASAADRDSQILAELSRYSFGSIAIDPSMLSKKVYSSFQDVGLPEPYTDANGNGKYDPGEVYTDVNNNGQWDADRGKDGAGNTGEVVRYQFDYTLMPFTGIVQSFIGGIHLRASTVVKNEPY